MNKWLDVLWSQSIKFMSFVMVFLRANISVIHKPCELIAFSSNQTTIYHFQLRKVQFRIDYNWNVCWIVCFVLTNKIKNKTTTKWVRFLKSHWSDGGSIQASHRYNIWLIWFAYVLRTTRASHATIYIANDFSIFIKFFQ